MAGTERPATTPPQSPTAPRHRPSPPPANPASTNPATRRNPDRPHIPADRPEAGHTSVRCSTPRPPPSPRRPGQAQNSTVIGVKGESQKSRRCPAPRAGADRHIRRYPARRWETAAVPAGLPGRLPDAAAQDPRRTSRSRHEPAWTRLTPTHPTGHRPTRSDGPTSKSPSVKATAPTCRHTPPLRTRSSRMLRPKAHLVPFTGRRRLRPGVTRSGVRALGYSGAR